MFRRKPASESPADSLDRLTPKPGGKGRPTPSRKEAQAAAKARAKAAPGRGARGGSSRASRAESAARMRQALRTGDERFLPARDKGPMRRFVRDFVDTKISFAELALPLVIVCFIPSFVGSPRLVLIANQILLVMIVVIILNLVLLRIQLGRELKRRFPGQPTRSLTWYMASRALQLRFIRAPKPQRRMGEQLPDSYH